MARGLILLLLSWAVGAQAQALPDPTRPPNVSQGAGAEAELPSGPTLQVIRSVNGVRSAIVSGQEVRVGGKVADQRVVRIDEDQVLLRGSTGTQVLKLFPGVVKTAPPETDKAQSRGDTARRKEAR